VRRQAAGFRYGPGVFVVHVALSRPLPWTAAEDLGRFSYVHLNARPEELARTYAECTAGKLPERPMMVVGQPSHADPSRAPAGHAVARIQVRAVPAALDWDAIKESYADRVLEQLEAHAPGARALILGWRVVSPLDLERENPNLIGGDCVSGSHHFDQNYLRRPFPGWSRYRTPVGRLYMVGASTWPGGGVNAASGWLAAGEVLRRH
jgi:phytoene dehydrogenase-like protein